MPASAGKRNNAKDNQPVMLKIRAAQYLLKPNRIPALENIS
jgi:hypothetical protein